MSTEDRQAHMEAEMDRHAIELATLTGITGGPGLFGRVDVDEEIAGEELAEGDRKLPAQGLNKPVVKRTSSSRRRTRRGPVKTRPDGQEAADGP
jgi:hypothetical protein